jgi:hypothetical protein
MKTASLFASAATAASLAGAALLPPRQAVTTVTISVPPPASAPSVWTWNAGATPAVPIHSSCNATQTALLRDGLSDAAKLAEHARQHVLRWGSGSDFYVKYFGNAPTAEVLGWYDKLANGDKTGVLFRCDDIDDNCQQSGWAGHWRGSNATQETVICDLSFTTRKPLAGLCAYGYSVASGALNLYFGSDLVHRLLHVPSVGEGAVEHYADTYDECLDLATHNSTEAARNSHSLQYFALDVYAYDVAVPGEGCTGKVKAKAEEKTEKPSATTTTKTAAAAPSTTKASKPSPTTDAPANCHTHSDGEVHCL